MICIGAKRVLVFSRTKERHTQSVPSGERDQDSGTRGGERQRERESIGRDGRHVSERAARPASWNTAGDDVPERDTKRCRQGLIQ